MPDLQSILPTLQYTVSYFTFLILVFVFISQARRPQLPITLGRMVGCDVFICFPVVDMYQLRSSNLKSLTQCSVIWSGNLDEILTKPRGA